MSSIIFNSIKPLRHHYKWTKNYIPTLSSTCYLNNSSQLEQVVEPAPKGVKKTNYEVSERGYYDTNAFVNTLVEHKFTKEQSETLCMLLKDIVNFISNDIRKECVTRPGQELAIQQIMIHIGSLKKDMIILEKSEFSTLRNENEKLAMEIKALKTQLVDEIAKLKGGFTLDLNLERNRSNEKTNEVINRVHKLDSRIDSENSNIKALLEAFKADCIRYIAGSLFSGMVILLGVLRLMT